MSAKIVETLGQQMDKGLQALQKELLKVRTGRATIGLVDHLHVDYYGSRTPLTQVANLTTPDARTIQITAWEPAMLSVIERMILEANIGFTPQNDGKVIRITMPPMTEDRRKELVKMVKKMGEEAKVNLRNHRRDANEAVKALEKNKELSLDEAKKLQDLIQKKTDDKSGEVEKIITLKEKEIMTV